LIYSIAGTFREPNLSDKRYHEVNVDAVRYLLEASLEHGVKRVVHCSTCGIHGNIVGHPANEEYPIRPVGIYEETKAAGEKLALDYGRSTGLDVVILRPTPVYGPGDTRLLKLFKLVSKKWAVLLGPGTAGYHLVYIDDLVDAFLLAGTVEDAAGESFLIGGSETPSLNAVIAALAEVLNNQDQHIVRLPAWPFWLAGWGCELLCRPLGVSPPIYRRRVEFFTNNRAYDIGKAQSILGYQPRVKMREGLKHTADWYRANTLL
jgi:nucleoside-diphosphate-sugar epimerase